MFKGAAYAFGPCAALLSLRMKSVVEQAFIGIHTSTEDTEIRDKRKPTAAVATRAGDDHNPTAFLSIEAISPRMIPILI